MSNPYMRESLIDEMTENQRRYKRPPGAFDTEADEPDEPTGSGATGGGTVTTPGENVSPWNDPKTSIYAPRVIEEGGQTYLTEHGNRRLLQPNEIEPARSYQADFWGKFPTGFQPGVGPQTNEEYQKAAATGGGGGAAAGPLGQSGATAGRYAGFDFSRAQDPTKSAKDAFLAAATASGSMPSSKADAEQWFNEYIKNALIQAGYQVDWVEGDKAFVRTRENPQGEEIDFLIGAGGENPMIGWQSNLAGQTTAPPAGRQPQGTAAERLLGNEDVNEDINAAIEQALESGMSLEDIIEIINSYTGA